MRFRLAPWVGVQLSPSRPFAFLAPVRLLGYVLTLDSDIKDIIFDGWSIRVNYFGKLTLDGVGVPNEKIGITMCIEGNGQKECETLSPEETGIITDSDGNYGFYNDYNLPMHVPVDMDMHFTFQMFTAYTTSSILTNNMPLRYCMGPSITDAYLVGTVTDAKTGLAIEGAAIKCDSYSATTDANGLYSILGIPAKAYTVTIAKVGYETKRINVDLPAGVPFTLNVSLQPAPPFDPFFLLAAILIGGLVLGVVLLPKPPRP